MDPLHVVKEVPSAGKAISRDRSVTSFKQTQVGVVSVAVQSMGFSLMTEKASVGRKLQLGIHTGGNLAAIRLQVRVQVFTAYMSVSSNNNHREVEELTGKRTSE